MSTTSNLGTFIMLLTIVTFPTSFASACNPQDKAALLPFKNLFPSNKLPGSWTKFDDCCRWRYVRCDNRTGRVTGLVISHRGDDIRGLLPSSIGDLSELELINFSNIPFLSGPLPTEFAKLTKLQSIMIWNTQISGPVPSYFPSFTSLKSLTLWNNQLVGPVPSSLGDLVGLSYIRLSGNKLTGTIPGSLFSKLRRGLLADLDLSYNHLTGPIPRALGAVQFRSIDLGSNGLTGDASFLFGKDKPLFYAQLSGNKLKFNLTNVEYPVKKLDYVDLSSNEIYGTISPQVLDCKVLGHFDVSNNKLCGQIPPGFVQPYFWLVNNTCLCGPPLPPCK